MLSKEEVEDQVEEKVHDSSVKETFKLIRDSVHDHFQDLTAAEEEWIDDSCVERYLKASKQDQSNCITRLINTLKWRRDYRPEQIEEEEVVDEYDLALLNSNSSLGLDRVKNS